ncbi:reduced growth phenotype protein 1, partial [Thamnocephalis sphaerospora]
FNLSLNGQRVALLRLAKTTFRLGDTVRGMLDFANAALSCYHVSIGLETVETIVPGHARGNAHNVERITRRRHTEWHAHCHSLSKLGFALVVPPELSPDFETSTGK